MQPPLLLLWLTIQKTIDHLTVGNALMLMGSCVTMKYTLVRLRPLDHPTEPMVFAANLASVENIATVIVPTLVVNLLLELETVTVLFSLLERIIKCLLFAQVLEINKVAELVMMQQILI